MELYGPNPSETTTRDLKAIIQETITSPEIDLKEERLKLPEKKVALLRSVDQAQIEHKAVLDREKSLIKTETTATCEDKEEERIKQYKKQSYATKLKDIDNKYRLVSSERVLVCNFTGKQDNGERWKGRHLARETYKFYLKIRDTQFRDEFFRVVMKKYLPLIDENKLKITISQRSEISCYYDIECVDNEIAQNILRDFQSIYEKMGYNIKSERYEENDTESQDIREVNYSVTLP